MMKRLFSLLSLVVVLGLGVPALAQDDEGIVDPETGVVYAKKTSYDFEEDVVEGNLVKPEGDYLDTRQRRKQSSLIKVREDFIPEMLKSAEDL